MALRGNSPKPEPRSTCPQCGNVLFAAALPRPDFHFPGNVGRTYQDSDPPMFPQVVRPPKGEALWGQTIRFSPPMCLKAQDADFLIDVLDCALETL